jgi:hypothetical protein
MCQIRHKAYGLKLTDLNKMPEGFEHIGFSVFNPEHSYAYKGYKYGSNNIGVKPIGKKLLARIQWSKIHLSPVLTDYVFRTI